MAVAQAIEARAIEMKTAEQFDPAGPGFGQGAVGFRYLEKRESGAAPVESFADQRNRPFEAGKNLRVDPPDFLCGGGPGCGQAGDLAFPPSPCCGDVDFGGQLFGLSALDIPAVGVVDAERYRDAENHCDIIVGGEMPKTGAQRNILNAVGLFKPDPRRRRLACRSQKLDIRGILLDLAIR